MLVFSLCKPKDLSSAVEMFASLLHPFACECLDAGLTTCLALISMFVVSFRDFCSELLLRRHILQCRVDVLRRAWNLCCLSLLHDVSRSLSVLRRIVCHVRLPLFVWILVLLRRIQKNHSGTSRAFHNASFFEPERCVRNFVASGSEHRSESANRERILRKD
jgi:hypothetical protein